MVSEEDQGAKGGHRIKRHEPGTWDEELGAGKNQAPGSGGAEARAPEPEAGVWNDARAGAEKQDL
jgi:hypothetical protein